MTKRLNLILEFLLSCYGMTSQLGIFFCHAISLFPFYSLPTRSKMLVLWDLVGRRLQTMPPVLETIYPTGPMQIPCRPVPLRALHNSVCASNVVPWFYFLRNSRKCTAFELFVHHSVIWCPPRSFCDQVKITTYPLDLRAVHASSWLLYTENEGIQLRQIPGSSQMAVPFSFLHKNP